MNDDIKKIQGLLEQNNGFITSTQVTELGVPRRCLSEMMQLGQIDKVARGIYALPESWEDELLFLQYRFSKGIYSHETALYLHGMTDRTPISYTMTFPKGYNCQGLKSANVKSRYTIAENYDLGICKVLTPCKNTVLAYDIERTLCDIVKPRHAGDIQVINQAMKHYASSKEKDIEKLMEYAEQTGVKGKVSNYMEVLL